jgi:AbrB family looped-hinge helix DNA binding protein
MWIVKHLDKQGRVVIPKKWRNSHLKENTVIMKIEDDRIIIEEYKAVDITKYFDSMEVDIESDLEDWDGVKGELLAHGRR